jgi:hypothetical protein
MSCVWAHCSGTAQAQWWTCPAVCPSLSLLNPAPALADLSSSCCAAANKQAVQAAQLTFKDLFVADLAMEPMKIVGFERVFGSLSQSVTALSFLQPC